MSGMEAVAGRPVLPVLHDCDPGHDDAIALLLSQAAPELEILAVTTCCGNQTIEKTTDNARRICTLLGIDAPIAMGRPGPMLQDPITAANIHGQSGLDGPKLPAPTVPLSALSAVELMAKTLRESPEPVTIISTGPMTNTACLLLSHPELKPKIRQISMMGGGLRHGNWSPAAEFNILVDPEAADVVFRSGIPILMAGLDVTLKALILDEDVARIRALGTRVAQVVADWLEFFYRFHREIGYAGAPLHDPCAVAALLRPELFEIRDYYVQVETRGVYCRGTTVGAAPGTTDDSFVPNARCLVDVDRKGFVDLLVEAVGAFS